MIVNFNNAESIVAWWQVHPERHWEQMQALARHAPQFTGAFHRASEMIRTDPALAPLLSDALLKAAACVQMGEPEAFSAPDDDDEAYVAGSELSYGSREH